MWRKIFIVVVGLLFVFPAFTLAGEGSDTIGKCNLLPQLRYSYTSNDFDCEEPGGNIFDFGKYDTHSVYLQVDYGICDYFDIYALVGVSFIDPDTSSYDIGDATILSFDLDYDPGIFWGVGVRGTFYRADSGFYVGAGVNFTHMYADLTAKAYINGVLTDSTSGDLNEYNLYADLHAGWHFKNIGLTPYIGVEYRQVWAELDMGGRMEMDNHNPVGPYVGFDYYINDRLYINAEGHMVDRWGANIGIGYLFDICPKPAPTVVTPEPPVTSPTMTPMK